ncbi:Holin, r1t-type [uncultured Caudovirales phage]|uniref:Holin, r1t-type n=1 Tax=uncultured Caudovirales phage TaxID=2100421 RepID=A0A6J7WJ34_9CAUD|nr:Holin, r1t-type [uncultured Caudovirales phage]
MSTSFWKAAVERALKSAAQAAILVVGAAQFDWLHADWKSLGLSVLAAAGLSVLTSLASIPYGVDGTPSLVGLLAATKNPASLVPSPADLPTGMPPELQATKVPAAYVPPAA